VSIVYFESASFIGPADTITRSSLAFARIWSVI
jgi:hypothetical protein